MADQDKRRSPSPRIRQKRRQARQDIVAATRKILRAQGLGAVTLDSVASELQMTKQALYHYFPSKAALVRSLVTTLLDAEIAALLGAVDRQENRAAIPGTLIRAFYAHYIDDLDSFRIVYSHTQLSPAPETGLDPVTLQKNINPLTRRLFDDLEERLAAGRESPGARQAARKLAFAAWTAALGLMTILSVAAASRDPLIYSDAELLDTLADTFDRAVT